MPSFNCTTCNLVFHLHPECHGLGRDLKRIVGRFYCDAFITESQYSNTYSQVTLCQTLGFNRQCART